MQNSQPQFLNTVLDNASQAIYVYDNKWRFIYLNAAAEKFWNRKKEDMLGKCVWELYPFAVGNIVYQEYHKAVKERRQIQFETYSFVLGKWIELHITPIAEGAVVCATEIGQIKNLETQLTEILGYKKVIEHWPAVIYLMVDEKGFIRSASQGYISIVNLILGTAFTRENLLGQPFQTISDLYGINYADCRIIRALNGEEITGEYWDYRVRKFLISASPILNNYGSIEGAVAFYEDITDYEHLRQEMTKLDRLNLVGEMAAGVAHEIRNPMTVIKGYLQFLYKKVPDNLKDQFSLILDELGRVEELISQFLSLANNKRIERKKQDLNAIVRNVYPLVLSDALKAGVQLELRLANDLPPLLLDSNEIIQLLLNLVRNSVEATSARGKDCY